MTIQIPCGLADSLARCVEDYCSRPFRLRTGCVTSREESLQPAPKSSGFTPTCRGKPAYGFSFPQNIITPVNLGKKLDVNYLRASRYVAEPAKGNVLHESYVGKYHLYANEPLLKLLKQ